MLKESGLLESFSECQTALQHFQLPQDSSKSSPQQFQHKSGLGCGCSFQRVHNASPGHQEPQIRSIFPDLCTGRWPNLAELVHCPSSIVMNSHLLSLGRSTSDPQKGCGSAWRAAQQPGEEPPLLPRDHSQGSQELHGCTCAHSHLPHPGCP